MLDIWKTIVEHLSWPVSAILLALLFRRPLTDLLGRINNIKAPGFELAAPQPAANSQLREETKARPDVLKGEIIPTVPESPTATTLEATYSVELENRREAVRNFGKGIPLVEENIKVIKLQLESLKMPLDSAETAEVLVRQLAVAQQTVRCERTHRLIFGSQIVALHLMNNAGPQSESALQPLFENARNQEPQFYGAYTFENWVGFLLKQGVAVRQDDGSYAITAFGKSYLNYIGIFATAPKPH